MSDDSARDGFGEVIRGATPEVRVLAERVRELIRDVLPTVVEVPWPRQGVIGYGVGPRKMSEHFCYISAHRRHVTLGFYYGAELPDPDGLLEGSGKLLRHLKIRGLGDVDNPAVRALIEAAPFHRMPR